MKFLACVFGLFLVVCSSAAAQYLPTPMIELDAVERALEDTSINTMEECLARRFGETTCEFLFQARSVMRSLRIPAGYAVEIDPVLPGVVRYLLLTHCPRQGGHHFNGWCIEAQESFEINLSYAPNRAREKVRSTAVGFTTYVHQSFFYLILREANALTREGKEMLDL